MRKISMLFIVTLILSITANSQQVRSSMFHLNEIEYNNDIIRAVSPNEIVVKTSSGEGTAFAFISNSTVQHYVDVPQGYTVNDFEILDGYVYFCGKSLNEDKGCIGMFNFNSSGHFMGVCQIVIIDRTKNLTRLVAYKGHVASTVGVAAIGEPEDANYTSCLVGLNNFAQQNSWNYSVGLSTEEIMTDITLAGYDELITVGKNKPEYWFGNLLNFNSLYLRLYKRSAIFAQGGGADGVYRHQNSQPYYINEDYHAVQMDEANIAVVKATVGTFSTLGSSLSKINIKIIDALSLRIIKQQTIDTTVNQVKDIAYFPNSKRLAVVASDNNGQGEVYFPDLSKNANYTAFKLFRDNTHLNSIARFNDDSFIMTSFLNGNYAPIRTLFIHESVNYYKESSCTRDANIGISTVVEDVYPDPFIPDPLEVHVYPVNFISYLLSTNETEVILDCASYYKKTINTK